MTITICSVVISVVHSAQLSKTKAALMQQQQVCSSYEKQLQRVQEQMMADIEEKEAVIEKIKMENEKYKVRSISKYLAGIYY